ncbi:hypothetical protein D9758_011324 [Tetrapyrgos nigripes]|uniref:Uncharacterized protein n=1 Tax=Tetrapyrgos nigripes TaxID=182062 RepID=A0A8H5G8D6_9AGAR|nr:hypothetical protein D9758_011324 [Tetrapyrgos nigripes]
MRASTETTFLTSVPSEFLFRRPDLNTAQTIPAPQGRQRCSNTHALTRMKCMLSSSVSIRVLLMAERTSIETILNHFINIVAFNVQTQAQTW